MAAPPRYLSYSIDSVLLTAALMLVTILPHAMYANGWLTVKLVLLVVYVVLGSFALKRGRTLGKFARHVLAEGRGVRQLVEAAPVFRAGGKARRGRVVKFAFHQR